MKTTYIHEFHFSSCSLMIFIMQWNYGWCTYNVLPYPTYIVVNKHHTPTYLDDKILIPNRCYRVPVMPVPQPSTTMVPKVDDGPSPKKKQLLQWRDIVSLMLEEIYTCELLSWSPKDTCGNLIMILVTSGSFIDNSGHSLTWTFIMVTLIINRHLW